MLLLTFCSNTDPLLKNFEEYLKKNAILKIFKINVGVCAKFDLGLEFFSKNVQPFLIPSRTLFLIYIKSQ